MNGLIHTQRGHHQPGVQNPEMVDLLTYNRKDRAYVLHMIEGRTWNDPAERLFELQEKINAYLDYVLKGELKHEYPDSADQAVCFKLHCFHSPRGQVAEYLKHLPDRLRRLGIQFMVDLLD